MDGTSAHIEVPATPPEDAVWQLAATDLGGDAAMLTIGLVALWRFLKSMIGRMLDTSKAAAEDADKRAKELTAAADARTEQLMVRQSTAIDGLAKAIDDVRVAVVRSDEHNQAAIASLRADFNRHETRLDRVDLRLDQHSDRLTGLEHGGSGVRRLRTSEKD